MPCAWCMTAAPPASHWPRLRGSSISVPEVLRSWVSKFTARDEATGAPAGVLETPEQELRRLRRENAVLRQEREFAKKVAVYFAKESR